MSEKEKERVNSSALSKGFEVLFYGINEAHFASRKGTLKLAALLMVEMQCASCNGNFEAGLNITLV